MTTGEAFQHRFTKIPASDDILLATDVYCPIRSSETGVLLFRTPYGRGNLDEFIGQGSTRDFTVVIQDVRGRGESEGTFQPFINEPQDATATIDWISDQHWFDEEIGVGVMGLSYLLAAGLPAASERDEVRTAIDIGGVLDFERGVSHGGAFPLHHMLPWSIMLSHGNDALRDVDWGEVFSPGPLEEKASVAGYENTLWDSILDNANVHRFSVWDRISEIDIPMLHIAGTYDVSLPSTLRIYHAVTEVSNQEQHLIIGPWSHNTVFDEELPWGLPAGGLDMFNIVFNWFERQLHGAPVELPTDSTKGSVLAFDAGQQCWRTYLDWPPTSSALTLSITGPSDLDTSKPSNTQSVRIWWHPDEPVPSRGGRLWEFEYAGLQPGPIDRWSLYQRNDVVLFTTEPLERPVQIAGEPVVELYLDTQSKEVDTVVRLNDIDPTNTAIEIADGMHRGNSSGTHLRSITLTASVHTFDRDHRIGLEVATSDFPRFDTPQVRNVDSGAIECRIQSAKANPSGISLPVVYGGLTQQSDNNQTVVRES